MRKEFSVAHQSSHNQKERREKGNSTINSKIQNSKQKGIRERERTNPRGRRSELGPVKSNLRVEGGEVDTGYGRETGREQVLGILMKNEI